MPYNNRYGYSLADKIDIVEEWEYQLENYSLYKNINIEVLEKFENLVREIFSELCNYYEKLGYKYFYEISNNDLAEICEYNEYEFLEDGTVF